MVEIPDGLARIAILAVKSRRPGFILRKMVLPRPRSRRVYLSGAFQVVCLLLAGGSGPARAAEKPATSTTLKEDRAQKLNPESVAKLSPGEQARYWVSRLRDQNGESVSGDSMFVFDDIRTRTWKTPGHELLKLGYPAVPALLEALGDQRFSRCIGSSKGFYFAYHVLTVSDVAKLVLARMAGRWSWESPSPNGPTAQAQIETWWKEAQEKGEKQMLSEAVKADGDLVSELARRLALLDPAAARTALMEVLKKRGSLELIELVEDIDRGLY